LWRIGVGRTLILFLFHLNGGPLAAASTTSRRCFWRDWLLNAIIELGDQLANTEENFVGMGSSGSLK
jgi:hypothetical protein